MSALGVTFGIKEELAVEETAFSEVLLLFPIDDDNVGEICFGVTWRGFLPAGAENNVAL